jgi:nucleotide-binding universal stress UspA family protein
MKRILIAYDGDEPARRALERGAELARAFGADLAVIIVGSRGLGPGGRFMQGSVSEHLATNAKATVIVAR